MRLARKVALSSVLSALALIIAPFSWFAWGPTKAFPGQHLVNVLAGVMVGPAWAAFIATVVGVIRLSVGIGTIFAFPGGIPGGVVVGLTYYLLKRVTSGRVALLTAALTEPVGTVLVGGTLAWYIFDPLFTGGAAHAKFGALLWLYTGWALSSLTGCILGAILLLVLDKSGALKAVTGES